MEKESKHSESTIEEPEKSEDVVQHKGNSPYAKIALLLIIVIFLGLFAPRIVKFIKQRRQAQPPPQTTISPIPTQNPDSKGTPAPTQKPGTIGSPIPTSPRSTGNKSDKYGVNTGIMVPEEPYFNSAMDQAGALGVGWIRLSNDWVDLEPSDNNWNFSDSDKYIDTARSKGLNVLYNFDPDLNGKFCTMSPAQVALGKVPQCSDEQFKDYITQIVSRYKGKVSYYELGNEPDLRRTWRDNPHEYAKALALAYPTLKAADPNAKLLLGGLALGGGQSSSVKWVQDFLNDKDNPPLNNFDIMNYHTYDKKDGITKQFNDVKSRAGNKPIWVTEVGFPSDPAEQQKNRSYYGYPSGEDGQAAYLNDILPHLLSLGVEKIFWYSLVDVPRDPQYFCTYSLTYIPGKQCVGASAGRITGGELKTKKAFDAYKSLATGGS